MDIYVSFTKMENVDPYFSNSKTHIMKIHPKESVTEVYHRLCKKKGYPKYSEEEDVQVSLHFTRTQE